MERNSDLKGSYGKDNPGVFAMLTRDKGFKIVFGTEGKSEGLLKSLLNRILDRDVNELSFRPTEKNGQTEEDSDSRFDIYCKDKDGSRFLVEMQMWSQHHFNKRAVYYSSLVVIDQSRDAKKEQNENNRKWDYDFEPAYVVCFLNFKNEIGDDAGKNLAIPYVSRYIYKNSETGKPLGDETNLIFVDLYRFRKDFEECEGDVEKWLCSIKNIHKLSDFPDWISGTELEDLYTEARLAAWDSEKRKKYEESMKSTDDYEISLREQLEDAKNDYEISLREQLEDAKNDYEISLREQLADARVESKAIGLEQGREEGMATGRAEERAEMARRMLALGQSAEFVSQCTGMSIEEVKCL